MNFISTHKENRLLQAKYNITGLLYDILDYPWERQYRRWRPVLLKDVHGSVLEAGVGTGRNLKYYHSDVKLTGIDLSPVMLQKANQRAKKAVCDVDLRHTDASLMEDIPSGHYDWLVSTFLCCVMPDQLQPKTIEHFERILKPGGRFCLLEIVYSKIPKLRKRQEFLAPLVEKVYGARFDRNTLKYIQQRPELEILKTTFLKDDTYLLIEGMRKK